MVRQNNHILHDDQTWARDLQTHQPTLAAERQHPISVTQLRACAQCSPHHLIRRMLTRHVIVAAGSVPEYAFYVFFLQNSKKLFFTFA